MRVYQRTLDGSIHESRHWSRGSVIGAVHGGFRVTAAHDKSGRSEIKKTRLLDTFRTVSFAHLQNEIKHSETRRSRVIHRHVVCALS
jgi:hypothetical protein